MQTSPSPLYIGEHQLTFPSDTSSPEMAIQRLQQVTDLLMNLPSYELDETLIPGTTLKWIGEALSLVGIELPKALPISTASLYRQYKKEDIDTPLKDHLISLLRIVDKGLHTWESEPDFREWLHARIENLGNQRPIDLLSLETGRREVEQALDRIEYGLYG